MTRPRCTTILRRFLDGESISWLVLTCIRDYAMTGTAAKEYVEDCIRRGLRGEVAAPRLRSKR